MNPLAWHITIVFFSPILSSSLCDALGGIQMMELYMVLNKTKE